MSKSAAQIKLEVEVGAAIGQVRRMTNEMKKLQQSQAGAAAAGKKTAGSTAGMFGNIQQATVALLKYRAIMLGIQTITDAVRHSMDKIAERRREAQDTQLTVSQRMREMSRYFRDDGSITMAEVNTMVRGARVTDHGELARGVQTALSTKRSGTTNREAIETAITVAEASGHLRGKPGAIASATEGAMAIYDASGGRGAAGSTPEAIRAQIAYMDRFTQLARSSDLQQAMGVGIPGVANLMNRGLTQSQAGALVTTLSTQAGDAELRKTTTQSLNMLAQIKSAFIKFGSKEFPELTEEKMLDLMTGHASEADTKRYSDITGKTRRYLLGQANLTSRDLDAMVQERNIAGLNTWQDVVRQNRQFEFEDQVGVGGALHGRAQMLSAIMSLLQGDSDSSIWADYKRNREALFDPTTESGLEQARKLREASRAQEELVGVEDIRRQASETVEARGQVRAHGGQEEIAWEQDFQAFSDAWQPEDYGRSGQLGWVADMQHQAFNRYIKWRGKMWTHGDPEAARRSARVMGMANAPTEEAMVEYMARFGIRPDSDLATEGRRMRRFRENMVNENGMGMVDFVPLGRLLNATVQQHGNYNSREVVDRQMQLFERMVQLLEQQGGTSEPVEVRVVGGGIDPKANQSNQTNN